MRNVSHIQYKSRGDLSVSRISFNLSSLLINLLILWQATLKPFSTYGNILETVTFSDCSQCSSLSLLIFTLQEVLSEVSSIDRLPLLLYIYYSLCLDSLTRYYYLLYCKPYSHMRTSVGRVKILSCILYVHGKILFTRIVEMDPVSTDIL